MATIVLTMDSGCINLDYVERYTTSIKERPGSKTYQYFAVFHMAGGETIHAELGSSGYDTLSHFEAPAQTVIPAPAGFTLLTYFGVGDGNSEESVATEPVIAWQIDTENCWHTAMGPFSKDSEPRTAVLLPDGQVMKSADCLFPDQTRWVEEERKSWLKEKKPKIVKA